MLSNFHHFLPLTMSLSCGEADSYLRRAESSALGHELVSQVSRMNCVLGIDAGKFYNRNSKEITCIATWAVSGSTAGAIGANVLSKACRHKLSLLPLHPVVASLLLLLAGLLTSLN